MVLATTLAGTAWSQSASMGSTPQILGYLNPVNNSFRPLGMQGVASPAALLPQSVVTGKIVTNPTITIAATAITQTTAISCEVSATVVDPQNIIAEEAAVIATRSPGAGKCTVAIPYSWKLTTAEKSTDRLILSYIITSVPSTTQPGLVFRTSSQSIANIVVPTSGATTTETVAATI